MKFNSKKFQAIRFAEMLKSCYYNNDTGVEIHQATAVKDLGIYLTPDLSFNHHIRIISKKGKKMAGWILRVFTTRSRTVMLTLLKQLIYPTIEYCCILWNPTDSTLIKELETIQNNFLRRIHAPDLDHNCDYWDRLRHYKLYSLQRHRERYAILYTWKVIHNMYPNPGLHFNNSANDHIQHPNEGIQINIHQRNDLTVHHPSPIPGWLSTT